MQSSTVEAPAGMVMPFPNNGVSVPQSNLKKTDNGAVHRILSGNRLHLQHGPIDLIIMVDAYHHVEQPAAYLASLHAALRPEGRLVIIDYDREKATRAWLKDHIRADAAEFRAEIESAGFRLADRHEGILKENFFFEFERR